MLAAAVIAAAVLAADPPLAPIDARREDVGPLRASLRAVEPGLEQPSGFDRVYRAPGGDGFMRIQGGLFALFPRSLYSGAAAPIPAGTVFHIGAPPGAPTAPITTPRPDPARIVTPADGRLIALSEIEPRFAEPSAPGTVEITIANDADFRARRIAQLVLRAVDVEESL